MTDQTTQEEQRKLAEHRKHQRFLVHWRAALVYKNDGTREVFQGRTYDISISGASLYSEHNIFVEGPITLLLAMQPLHPGQSETTVEIQCRMIYTVLSSHHHRFRIGLHFLHFKDDGKAKLQQALSKRSAAVPF
ncbi:MAG: PilZ domain-containing protein [Nitrosomonadales bacterium]|nr:PilZ domain-containing protein [Nitrosomonadales bacterium]